MAVFIREDAVVRGKDKNNVPQNVSKDAIAQLNVALDTLVGKSNEGLNALKTAIHNVNVERTQIKQCLAVMLHRLNGDVTITQGELESLDPNTQISTSRSDIGMRFFISKGGVRPPV